MNLDSGKAAEQLVEELQSGGKCANGDKARQHIVDVIQKHTNTYNKKVEEWNKIGVISKFKRFSTELQATLQNESKLKSVLTGMLGIQLFTSWEKEQLDVLLEACIKICGSELRYDCNDKCKLDDEDMRSAIIFVRESVSSSPREMISDLLSALKGKK